MCFLDIVCEISCKNGESPLIINENLLVFDDKIWKAESDEITLCSYSVIRMAFKFGIISEDQREFIKKSEDSN